MSDKSIKEIIAKNLQLYRKKQGLTQKELAAMLNVRGSAISNWETGANSIDIDTLVRACEIFGTTINDMYEAQSTSSVTMAEYEIIKKYRTLDEHGKRNVDNILQNEYERCADSSSILIQGIPGTLHEQSTFERMKKEDDMLLQNINEKAAQQVPLHRGLTKEDRQRIAKEFMQKVNGTLEESTPHKSKGGPRIISVTKDSYQIHTLAAHERAGATEEEKQHDYNLLEQIKKDSRGVNLEQI